MVNCNCHQLTTGGFSPRKDIGTSAVNQLIRYGSLHHLGRDLGTTVANQLTKEGFSL
jgi:hypothetical protein